MYHEFFIKTFFINFDIIVIGLALSYEAIENFKRVSIFSIVWVETLGRRSEYTRATYFEVTVL